MRQVFNKKEAAARRSSQMEGRDHSKNTERTRERMSRGNLRFALLMSISMAGISLFGQVADQKEKAREMISNISSIVECDAKELGLILSVGSELISNYLETSMELEKTQKLTDYFSHRAGKLNIIKVEASELAKHDLNMTLEELGEEIVKRIGSNILGNYRRGSGTCSKKSAIKMRDILTQELEVCKFSFNKAEKALEENIQIVEIIPSDYRYPLALSEMLRFVRNGRATSWKECADKYEEQLHRWKMEANSAENLQIQKEIRNLTGQVSKNTKSIARSSRATAIFTGLIYLGW